MLIFWVCQVELQVVLLTSTKTQIPFDYYNAPYCQPDTITKEAENLGEVRFQPSSIALLLGHYGTRSMLF